ncbi:MAG TPA: hypothetical protein VFE98_10305 [Candidatus Bathyarchaeia archaeon]|nr:hypothetical protein [Candidatus Bathyarchaeia archaeon]
MPKKTSGGIPKSVIADLNRVKARIAALEKSFSSMGKEWKTSSKGLMDRLKKYDTTIATLGKRSAKKAKRKPSEYNLFLKDKMSQGMSMVDAVKAWKEKDGGMSSASTSSSRETDSWQSSTQES